MHVIFSVNIDSLTNFPLAFIPLTFLIERFLVAREFENHSLSKIEFIPTIIIGCTLLNILLKMPILYDLFFIIFLIIQKDRSMYSEKQTQKNIQEYFSKQKPK